MANVVYVKYDRAEVATFYACIQRRCNSTKKILKLTYVVAQKGWNRDGSQNINYNSSCSKIQFGKSVINHMMDLEKLIKPLR